MRRVLILLASGLAAPAAAGPVIAIDGAYTVGVAAVPSAASSNPLHIDSAVPDIGTAISIGHVGAAAGVSAGVLTFRHVQWGIGTGDGQATTRITDSYTNSSLVMERVTLKATILAGEVGLAAVSRMGDDRFNYFPSPIADLDLMAAFDFVLRIDGVPVWSASAMLDTASGVLAKTTGGSFLSLNGLTLVEDFSQAFWRWDSTILTIPLGNLAPGETRSFDYGLMTMTRSDSLCFWGAAGCGLVTVSFDDPRCAGCPLGFLAEPIGDRSGPGPFDVPAPAALLLFGLGAGALATLRRRRPLP
jgi:hypothetical protein